MGVPVTYFSNSKTDLIKRFPNDGLKFKFDFKLNLDAIKENLNEQETQQLYETLLLSQDAKNFALALSLARTNHFLSSFSNIIMDVVWFSAAYIYSYASTRAYKYQLKQRKQLINIKMHINIRKNMYKLTNCRIDLLFNL